MPTTVASITGNDNIVPIYNPNSRWTVWRLEEIYMGQQGASRYVPNLDDYVIDISTNDTYIVDVLNMSTLVPTLKLVTSVASGNITTTDLLLGVGPGTQSDTYRVYIDKSVMPFTMAVDARLRVAGTMAKTAMIFKGSALTNNEKVISGVYDQTGNLIGQSLTLELVAMPAGQNISIKTVPVCYTTEDLTDGEIVTIVCYSDSGHVVSKRQLLIENTAFIRSSNSSLKYIAGITLETPFLSSSDPTLIQYPMNVPVSGLNLIGIVHYSDGSSLRMPVDGTKFSIFGFSGFISTIIGQKIPIVLTYNLSSTEIAYGANVGQDKFISQSYRATTVKANGAFTVKLFGYPVWIDAVNGYRIEWYIYNLDRNLSVKVTPYVTFNVNSRVFNPILYGVTQQLSVSINLKDVNGSFDSYIHVQTVSFSLLAPGGARSTNWTVAFDPNQNPAFGQNNFASTTLINQNLCKIKVDSGATNLDDWLERLYYRIKPLTDEARELNAPRPNYFRLIVEGQTFEYPIAEWNSEHSIGVVAPNNGTVFIKFFIRTNTDDIKLAVSALPIYQSN